MTAVAAFVLRLAATSARRSGVGFEPGGAGWDLLFAAYLLDGDLGGFVMGG